MQRGRSAAFLQGVNPDYRNDQVQLEDTARAELQRVVAMAAAGDCSLLDELEFGGPSMVSGLDKLRELTGDGRGPITMVDSPVTGMTGPLGQIAASADAAERVRRALARWKREFLDMVRSHRVRLSTPRPWNGFCGHLAE